MIFSIKQIICPKKLWQIHGHLPNMPIFPSSQVSNINMQGGIGMGGLLITDI